jgi:hypothetical protein
MLSIEIIIVVLEKIAIHVDLIDPEQRLLSSDVSDVLNGIFEVHVGWKINFRHESLVIYFVPDQPY